MKFVRMFLLVMVTVFLAMMAAGTAEAQRSVSAARAYETGSRPVVIDGSSSFFNVMNLLRYWRMGGRFDFFKR